MAVDIGPGRRFYLNRKEDVSGVSGLGIVANGCQFHHGYCALTWRGEFSAGAFYPSIEKLIEVHGHDHRTEVIWIDEPDGVDIPEVSW